eukprot:364111-Chlamydomonas_euryale.AAC.13
MQSSLQLWPCSLRRGAGCWILRSCGSSDAADSQKLRILRSCGSSEAAARRAKATKGAMPAEAMPMVQACRPRHRRYDGVDARERQGKDAGGGAAGSWRLRRQAQRRHISSDETALWPCVIE